MVIPAVLATASSSSVFFMYWMLLLGVERSPAHIRPLSAPKVKHLRTSNHIVANAINERKRCRVVSRCRIPLKTKDIRVIRAPHGLRDARILVVAQTLRQSARNRLCDPARDDVIAIDDPATARNDHPSTMPFSYPSTGIATLPRPRERVQHFSLRPPAVHARVAVEGVQNARVTSRRVGLLALLGCTR